MLYASNLQMVICKTDGFSSQPKKAHNVSQVHVGHNFIHAKFQETDCDRRADMAKKPKFWIFEAIFRCFLQKNGTLMWFFVCLGCRTPLKLWNHDGTNHMS